MAHIDEASFLDLLYDAALDPVLWAPVMEQLADLIGGDTGFLSRLSVIDGSGSGLITRIDPAMEPLYRAHYGRLNPYSNEPDPRAFMATWHPKVLTGEAWLPDADLIRTEYYNDFLVPSGVRSTLIIRLSARRFEVCSLTIGKPQTGQFSPDQIALAERLRPHLTRAFDLSQKLSELRFTSPDVEAALNQSPYGIFVLDGDGRLQRTNRIAEMMLLQRRGLRTAEGRLTAIRAPAARHLEQLIAQASSRSTEREGGSIILRAGEADSPMSVTVTPVRSAVSELFGNAPAVLVCVTDPTQAREATASQLQALFLFTPAEARVGLLLLEGVSARQCAERLGVSFHTVRHQIQAMLEKTGVSRQANLLALLARTAAPPA